MVNPTPFSPKSSPYSVSSAAGIPRTLTNPTPPTQPRRWKPLKRVLLLGPLVVLIAAATYALLEYRSIRGIAIVSHRGQDSSILGYNPNDTHAVLDTSALTHFGDGRFTMVVVGVGGEGHEGPYLTDSIKVVSLDTVNKSMTVTSIPRDFYYSNAKINATYQYGEEMGKGGGGLAIRNAVSEILGVPVSHFAMIDFAGMKELVDALGGVTVKAPESLTDYSYPDDKGGYAPFSVKAGTQIMDGTTALKYARTRKADNDYKRQERQNILIGSIREKAMSLGILANPVKVSNIVSVLGNHFRTDLQPADIRSLISLLREMPSGSTTSYVLDTSPDLNLLTSSSNTAAGFISYPIAGMKDYSAIRDWYASHNPDPILAREAPTLTLAGTAATTAKQLTAEATTLRNLGYQVVLSPTPAPATHLTSTKVYTNTGKKPVSRSYLGSFFGTSPTSAGPLKSDSDFEVVYIPSSKR